MIKNGKDREYEGVSCGKHGGDPRLTDLTTPRDANEREGTSRVVEGFLLAWRERGWKRRVVRKRVMRQRVGNGNAKTERTSNISTRFLEVESDSAST